jgi:arylsulfatase A-like enzyme
MPPPNIVMILVDDADRKAFGNIPRIKAAIADQGATASNYFLNHPLCAPSRATLLRGQYEHNTGVNTNADAHGEFVAGDGEDSNLATWLQTGGYKTALIGKYINGYPGGGGTPDTWVPPGWDSWFALFGTAYDSYDYEANDNGTVVHYGTDRADYATDVLTGKALDFLGSDLAAGPFFMLLAPTLPHGPAVPAPEYQDDFPGVTYPRGAANPSFNEADVSDKPLYIKREARFGAPRIALIDESYRKKLQCMESIEDMVEAVVGALGSRLENTYVIITSDNGYHMGEHRLGWGNFPGGKNMLYEEDIRVPLWIRGPGIAPGTTVTELLGNVDLAPTACQIAGVTPGLDVDGRSFLPLVQGTSIPWRTSYLISRGGNRAFAGIRSKDDYVFAEFDELRKDEVPGEYYNLATDPYQLTNGYNTLSSEARTALRKRVKAYRRCVGEKCRLADSS